MTYGYDGSGHIVSMVGWFTGVFTYTYDPRGQLSSVVDPGYPALGTLGGTTTYTYDALGRVVTQQYANGSTSTFAYDAVGRTLQVRHASASHSEIDRAFYAYDALGRPLHLDAAHARHTYTYDALDQLVSEDATYPGANGTVSWQLTTYTYDAADRRTVMTQLGRKTVNQHYDAADQLTQVTSTSGFPTASGTSYAFLYDANGRRIVRQDSHPGSWPSGPYLTTFMWDAAGRLSSFAGYPASASVAAPPTNPTVQTFTYDNAGMRHGHITPDGSVDNLLWNPADGSPLGWVGAAGTPASSLSELFVQAPEGGKTLRALGETHQGVALSRQYHLDGQGSVEAQTGGSGASSEEG